MPAARPLAFADLGLPRAELTADALVTKLLDGFDRQLESGSPADDALQLRVLRQFRNRHLVRILWQELDGGCPLWQTLGNLSALADACIRVAVCWAHAATVARFGEPRNQQGQAQQLIVLGMGKLGGGELNVSSDVDLIFLYGDSGQTDGRRALDNGDFFARVSRQITKLLSTVTEDGFVYRVDTRLRPFGESGPLAVSLVALEHYLLTQARDWERYAMIKARAVVGAESDVVELDALLRPFVFRRYLDYNAIDALRALKRKIALSVRQRGMQDNIKLGQGGIREVEFIVQAFQLVRGGREPRLRERSIRRVFPVLAELGLLETDEVDALREAYVFLRRAENALQAMRDRQVHSLPEDAADRARLACMLDFADWAGCVAAINAVRATVSTRFDGLFSEEGTEQTAGEEVDAAAIWARFGSPELDLGQRAELLEEVGIEPQDGVVEALIEVAMGAWYERLAAPARLRVDRLVPLLLHSAPAAADRAGTTHGATVLRGVRFVRAVAGRSGYLQVLIDHPPALDRLVDLFAHSGWIAKFVTRHPIVLDELVGPSANRALPSRQGLHEELAREVRRIAPADLEQQMDALRQWRNAHVLHVACAELDGELGIMQVSDQLSWLAEALVDAVLELVAPPLEQRFGRPTCVVDGESCRPHIGIVAYGKLGGLELGYGSDLDLVFVHDSRGSAQLTDGAKPIENAVFYGRLARAFATFMSTRTPAGVLYEIDTRLRPNGQSGLLVTAFEAYEQYQRQQAWTWEHQALVRSRMVAGVAALQQRFDAMRVTVLQQPRSVDVLRGEVVAMRQRMRENLASGRAGGMDLKQDAGGVVDIEFLVQYLVLAHASAHLELCAVTDNIRLLDALQTAGLLAPADASTLRDDYRELRARLHRQALREEVGPVALDRALEALRERVSGICGTLMKLPA